MEFLKYIRSNISNLIFILFIAVIFFSTDARTMLIRGIMFTGLFNAEASADTERSSSNRKIPAGMTFRSEDGQLAPNHCDNWSGWEHCFSSHRDGRL